MKVCGPLIPPRRGDAGYDIPCLNDVELAPGEQMKIPTGIYVEIPPWCVGLIHDRSSVAGKRLYTHAGVIDSIYRGEIKVLLENGGDEHVVIKAGSRIAQLLVVPIVIEEIEYVNTVDELSSTERGDNGWGSTDEAGSKV